MIAAVSGGADSVCLLHVLREVGVNVAGVAHFNHKWRGEESEEDERFVASMAGRMGLAFFRSEMPGEVAKGNPEEAARGARRSFFERLIRDDVCDRVALGHTRDDQAETVLFRVLRGSGLTGLAGIHPVNGRLIRPLIGVRRSEVEEFLRSRNLSWREDATNRETRFARNRIRHELMPQLARDWNPRVVDALANLADLAYEEERRWDLELGVVVGEEAIRLDPGDRALARRQVRKAVQAAKGDLRGIDFEHIESVIEMKGARVTLPGVEAVRSFDLVRFTRSGPRAAVPAIEITIPGTYRSPDGASEIRLEACDNLELELPAPIVLRGWRPGDHYRPVGKSRDQKLKKMFQNARVPSWERRFWPILECDGKILWAREFGAAEDFAALRVSETHR